ncbi:MAG: helix-turn-helix transcriptional regulator, partial [Steroidobacteraceae bacterium]|nr:helix-turn-helix transcriptional regulator [Steroidobacteraceae bacterium]
MITLDKLIKKLREDRGWSQQALADAARISQTTVGNIEAGIRGAKGTVPSSLPKIAKALGMSTDDLLEQAGLSEPTGLRLVTGGSPARVPPAKKDEAALLSDYRQL